MGNIHHRSIKRFSLDGVISDDTSIGRLKIEYIRLIKTEMKFAGYVVRLDIDPDFTIEYNESTETFNFKLSLYGTYVGKKKSECIIGIDGTEAILIQKSRSSELSQGQESQLNQK
jgi:hypothetical protein